jgi:hypothetical protein
MDVHDIKTWFILILSSALAEVVLDIEDLDL